jgi:hypothetical protein
MAKVFCSLESMSSGRRPYHLDVPTSAAVSLLSESSSNLSLHGNSSAFHRGISRTETSMAWISSEKECNLYGWRWLRVKLSQNECGWTKSIFCLSQSTHSLVLRS